LDKLICDGSEFVNACKIKETVMWKEANWIKEIRKIKFPKSKFLINYLTYEERVALRKRNISSSYKQVFLL